MRNWLVRNGEVRLLANMINDSVHITKTILTAPNPIRKSLALTHEAIYDYAIKEAIKQKGLLMEFGVFEGSSLNFFAQQILPKRVIYGFDSFEGHRADENGFSKGFFDRKGKLPNVLHNAILVKGRFNDTLTKFLKKHKGEKIAFMHIDCDTYSSTKEIFDSLKNVDLDGTLILFGIYYNYPDWKNGEHKALEEYTKNSLHIKYIAHCPYTGRVLLKLTRR